MIFVVKKEEEENISDNLKYPLGALTAIKGPLE